MTPLTQELIQLSGWQPDGEDFTLEELLAKIGGGVRCGIGIRAWASYKRLATTYADTPLEALKLLAIELFRQGVLKKGGSNG